jgi:type I restriction enzyme, S subunit
VDEQRRIAGVLAALDLKIAHNQKMSEGLRFAAEQMLAASTSQSYVKRCVGDVMTFFNNKRVPLSGQERATRQGEYRYFGASGIIDRIDSYIFDGIYLLVGEDGSVITESDRALTQYVWGRFWVNNHAHTIQGLDISTELAYVSLSRADVSAAITGAVQPKLSMTNLKAVELVLPEPEELAVLETRIAPLFALLRGLSDETMHLTEARRLLLPRVVSGEFPVPTSYAAGPVLFEPFEGCLGRPPDPNRAQ